MSAPALYDVEAAAAYLDRRAEWVAKAARRGDIPGSKVGRYWRFTEADLAEYLERNRRNADPWARTPRQEARRNRRSA